MEFDLQKGISRTEKYIVEEQYIADFLGSGKIEVLSTPSMILWMENTAMLLAQEHLPEGWITVGTAVNIKHLRASKLGAEITVTATLKEFKKKHLVLEVVAYEGEHKIGEGKHERHIVNKEKFLARL
jgi:predicted thioesterase